MNIWTGKPREIFDPKSEFSKLLEIYKLKSEIKPRRVNVMQSQDVFADTGMIDESKIRVVCNYGDRR